ncbi:YheC/YheD family protein [Brevibacillus massiliensis]|uniref:YheC/YheD family protein n=1 Tax=Brevibacillus massiliensis TaxID=1118054 RepID=UPI00030227DE|nr:YheC/YheD family protein [Brevibacillus massiliensis]
MSQKNKWKKYLFLKQFEGLAPYLPKTRMLTEHNFRKFIEEYGKVILKPVYGRGGRGVIQVSPLENHRYEIHREKKKKRFIGKKWAYKYIKSKIGSSPYMVQRRIPLAKVDNRPFDMRIIVQRKKHSDTWVITAKAAKVAGKGYIVTNNTRSKGKLLHVESALHRSSLYGYSQHELLSRIEKVALRAARRLSLLFPHHRIYGLDMGVDRSGDIWIIETNLFPAMSHFRKLGDQTMYYRIKSYKKG